MEPAGVRVPSLVPPMTQFHKTRPSTATGQPGFRFVDEVAPPQAIKALADELQRRNRAISWWGNIRFEKSFTPELCRQFAKSGSFRLEERNALANLRS